MPSRKKGMYSIKEGGVLYSASNMVSFPVPVGFRPARVIAATDEAKNARIIVMFGKIVLASSNEKSTPPNGAPNATATPAAHAQLRSSLCLASFELYRVKNLANKLDQQQAMCTSGPSLPQLRPAATERLRPTTFTTKVFHSSTCAIVKPPRMVLISGIPLPRAMGANAHVIAADMVARMVQTTTKPQYPLGQPIQSSQSSCVTYSHCPGQYPNLTAPSHSTVFSMKAPEHAVQIPTMAGMYHCCASKLNISHWVHAFDLSSTYMDWNSRIFFWWSESGESDTRQETVLKPSQSFNDFFLFPGDALSILLLPTKRSFSFWIDVRLPLTFLVTGASSVAATSLI
mmetsp:Transcript_14359/g.26399  ORF Transcript_14359/g.26399 Transcript_14359/m.26399 type:complete len:343 (-) Transcript_14359:72-1100(-)